jgi:hypothetical protein
VVYFWSRQINIIFRNKKLPTFELKYNKETTSNSTNTNTINNSIIIKHTSDNLASEIPPENTNIDNSTFKNNVVL